MSNHRQGDWICHCSALNFSLRDTCYKCGDFRSKSVKPRTTIKRGDWNCVSCGELNFASRISCRKCFTNKNTNEPLYVAGITVKPGDWLCQVCKSPEYNFGSRTNCRQCGAAKPTNNTIINSTNNNNNNTTNNDDDQKCCKICFERPITVTFTSCGHVVCCDVCCYAMDKCPVCRKTYTENQILKIFMS
ncbi:RNA-binding protein cabeza [Tupanvirus deep ocean]|uniref:RNA-binding protein cabeza n=2 Tax=Tupanvirus TaxID=2094720 RepID=A0AC62A7U1_9VIRU|nr:RNA-binding protein cabeza [Tupanvirus deep ocean]QKU33851.1 RNA-binding protein cabeza [Tupanvirus deep ocean]